MSGKILNKKLTAGVAEASYALGSMIRGISIYNYGSGDALLDFDHIIDDDSRLLQAGQSISIAADFQTLYYKRNAAVDATLYITFIQNP
ncbi:MAG TPA: hypothetical protein VJL60_02975 [Gammaproteobacteria bacterium]|nr:hypothetical protein [Gammaproteobacteria bacterium]